MTDEQPVEQANDEPLETDFDVIRKMPDLELANWFDRAIEVWKAAQKLDHDFTRLMLLVEQEIRIRIASYRPVACERGAALTCGTRSYALPLTLRSPPCEEASEKTSLTGKCGNAISTRPRRHGMAG